MLWYQKKTQQKTSDASDSMFGMGQSNPYENFEISYRQESEIHRQWQHIEDVALFFKRKYEGSPDVLEYIDAVRSAEKIFAKGKIKHWSNEQIREELIRNHIEDMSTVGKIDGGFANKIYEEFKASSATAVKVDETIRILLEKYAERSEYHAFILFLRDVYISFIQSSERGESNTAFKDRLVGIRMGAFARSTHVEISELEQIYKEFKEALVKSI